MQLVGIQIYNLDIARIKNQRNERNNHSYHPVTETKQVGGLPIYTNNSLASSGSVKRNKSNCIKT